MSSSDPISSAAPPTYSWRTAVRGNVLMIGLVSLFTDFSSEMVFPLLPVFIAGLIHAADQGLSTAQVAARAAIYVGIMGGLAETTASLLKLFSGRISDRLGKRKALVAVGYGISTVARPLMALAGAAWHVVALRVGDRVGKGIRTSPRDALISDAVGPEVRGLAFSFHRVMDHTGAILGPVVAVGILYLMLGQLLWKGTDEIAGPRQTLALRWLFAIALLPGLAAMVTIFTKVREIAPKAPAGQGQIKAGALRLLPRRFYAFVGIVTLFALGNSSDLFLLLYGQKLFGLGLLEVIALWVVLHVSKVIFSIPGGVLSDHVGRRPLIVAGWAVYAAVYLGMASVAPQARWLFWGLVVVYGLYYGMTEGAEKALVADFIPSEHRGTAYGLYHGAVGLAALPASLMFGVFWAVIGPVVAFGIGAALAGAAAVLLAILLSTTPRTTPA